MRHVFVSLFLLVPALVRASPLDDARNAYSGYQVGRAEALYHDVVLHGTPVDRVDAEVELARIEWLVDGQAAGAIARLERVLPAAARPCAGAYLLGRVLEASGRAAEVAPALAPYDARCDASEPGVALARVDALLTLAERVPPASRSLTSAQAAWHALPEPTRAGLEASLQELRIGLLRGDGALALVGWCDYLWLTTPNDDVARVFTAGVRRQAPRAAVLALVELLVRAGFAHEADVLLRDHDVPPPRTIAAYLALRSHLAARLLAHDRAYARGHRGDEERYERALLDTLRDAIVEAGEARPDDPWPALARLWCLHGTTGMTNGVMSLHLGHAVVDEDQVVAQGARRGSIHFIALDNMLANSFSGWLWDGSAAPGGWAHDGVIVQVRPLYARDTLRHLALAHSGAVRD